MENMLGLLRMRVIRGKNLAIRDFFSSDPYVYVVVRLGNQTVKTRVIKKNVNPLWDEDLTVSVINPALPLKLLVRDKDTFSKDDDMGDAAVDLQPLFLAALKRAMNPAGATAEAVTFHTVQMCKENFLTSDSHIKSVKGQLVQDICLKLQNVQTGELELQLKWIDVACQCTRSNVRHSVVTHVNHGASNLIL